MYSLCKDSLSKGGVFWLQRVAMYCANPLGFRLGMWRCDVEQLCCCAEGSAAIFHCAQLRKQQQREWFHPWPTPAAEWTVGTANNHLRLITVAVSVGRRLLQAAAALCALNSKRQAAGNTRYTPYKSTHTQA